MHLLTKNKRDGRRGDDVIELDDKGYTNLKAFLVAIDSKDIKGSILIPGGSGNAEYDARLKLTKLAIRPEAS